MYFACTLGPISDDFAPYSPHPYITFVFSQKDKREETLKITAMYNILDKRTFLAHSLV